MRLVTVRVPQGEGENIVQLALTVGASEVSVHQAQLHKKDHSTAVEDVVEFDAPTPIVRAFVEELMGSTFYNPHTCSFVVRHPRSVVAQEPPSIETQPIVVPTVDIYEELWQFAHVTASFVGRVFLAALLLSYGMIEMHQPLLIAGLLFLPYHHQMLSMSLGFSTREWRLVGQGALALLVSTLLIIAAGVVVATLTQPPLRFHEFGSPLTGFLIALVIGIAAALATADDAGRRELIGLAATAHISVIPAWLGITLVFGLSEATTVIERLFSFGLSVGTLILAAGLTYMLLGMHGRGIRRFAKQTASGGSG